MHSCQNPSNLNPLSDCTSYVPINKYSKLERTNKFLELKVLPNSQIMGPLPFDPSSSTLATTTKSRSQEYWELLNSYLSTYDPNSFVSKDPRLVPYGEELKARFESHFGRKWEPTTTATPTPPVDLDSSSLPVPPVSNLKEDSILSSTLSSISEAVSHISDE